MKMIKYAAFLRGINVGGRHLVKMEDLRALMASMNFENVKTFIQSGNVIFESAETDADALAGKIERGLKESLGFEVKTMPRTFPELEAVVRRNPFQEPDAGAKTYICFLSAEPDKDSKDSLLSLANDFEIFHFRNREMYCLVRPNNPARELFSNNFIEKRLKVSATTRNITTVNKILLLK
jgi:uncharacterized protein (DUF1697 family)